MRAPTMFVDERLYIDHEHTIAEPELARYLELPTLWSRLLDLTMDLFCEDHNRLCRHFILTIEIRG